jgi:ribosomal protein S14
VPLVEIERGGEPVSQGTGNGCSIGGRERTEALRIARFDCRELAVRTIDGIDNPAAGRSEIITSPVQPRFAALVIIASHKRPCVASSSPAAITRAGRFCRICRSE